MKSSVALGAVDPILRPDGGPIAAAWRTRSLRALAPLMQSLRPFSLLLAMSLALSLALSLIAAGSCAAQTVRSYSVIFDAPDALAAQLNKSLDIARYVREQTLPVEEFQRLAANAPQQIREVLATEGYFSPSVTLDSQQQGERLIARFIIVPGVRTLVDSVDIRYTGDIANRPDMQTRRERLRQQWGLRTGAPFTQKRWTDAKTDLLKSLLNRDYPAAKIAASEARIEPERQRAQLSVTVDSGPPFTFGELDIYGLQRYPRRTVESRNPIQPGERFSQEKLNDLQSRVQETGYFRSAFATIEVDPEHPERVPVRLDLTENERRRLALGGGISTDTGPRLQARWLDRRFLGRDWRLESAAKVDRVSSALGGDLFFPPRDSGEYRGWYPSIGSHYTHTEINNERNDKLNAIARFTSPSRIDEQSWSLGFYTDRQQIFGQEPNNRQAFLGGYRYTQRRLDNLISPRRGHVVTIEAGVGKAGLLNESSLARILTQGTLLLPLDPALPRFTAVLRAQVGQVFGAPRERVPDDLLFRTGGDQTVRGYSYNSLGVPVSGAVVSGRVLGVVSAEMVYRLTSDWGVAVFTDAGNAADSWRDFHLARGTGTGVRWRSPVGPVNVDLAFAHETRQPRLHFSLGYAF